MSATPDNDLEIHDWRLWWFARLETALNCGDQIGARTALENLARLGIGVRFLLPPAGLCADCEANDGR